MANKRSLDEIRAEIKVLELDRKIHSKKRKYAKLVALKQEVWNRSPAVRARVADSLFDRAGSNIDLTIET